MDARVDFDGLKLELDHKIRESDWEGLDNLLGQLSQRQPALSSGQISFLRQQYASTWWRTVNCLADVRLERRCHRHTEFVRACFLDNEFADSYLRDYRHEHLDNPERFCEVLSQERLIPPLVAEAIHWVAVRGDEPVGLVSVASMQWRHRSGEFLVGFPIENSSIVSVSASILAIQYCFQVLQFEKLFSYVHSDNLISQKSTESLGFSREGLLREEFLNRQTGKRMDLIRNGLLASEFDSDRIRRLSKRLGLSLLAEHSVTG